MTCNGCRSTVEKALKLLSPDVVVTLEPPRVVFPASGHVSLDAVRSALQGLPKYVASELDGPSPPQLQVKTITEPKSWFSTYFPLLLIFAFVSTVSFAGHDGTRLPGWMNHFMAGFFLVFSFFKLLDIRGFADAFATYDELAKRWKPYGFIYPFLELALGFAYLFAVAPVLTNAATIALMGFGSIGVANAVLNKRKIQCACLGTVLNLPMSTVTLIENGIMIMMAIMSFGIVHG